jgi:hypothetical protein
MRVGNRQRGQEPGKVGNAIDKAHESLRNFAFGEPDVEDARQQHQQATVNSFIRVAGSQASQEP